MPSRYHQFPLALNAESLTSRAHTAGSRLLPRLHASIQVQLWLLVVYEALGTSCFLARMLTAFPLIITLGFSRAAAAPVSVEKKMKAKPAERHAQATKSGIARGQSGWHVAGAVSPMDLPWQCVVS